MQMPTGERWFAECLAKKMPEGRLCPRTICLAHSLGWFNCPDNFKLNDTRLGNFMAKIS